MLVPDGNEFQPGLNLDDNGMDRQPSFGWTGGESREWTKNFASVLLVADSQFSQTLERIIGSIVMR